MMYIYKIMFSGTLLIGIVLFLTVNFKQYIGPQYKLSVRAIKGENVLLDMAEIHYSNSSALDRNVFLILFINKPRYMDLNKGNSYLKNSCHFKNCFMTDIVRNISEMSVIVFNAQDNLPFKGEYLKQIRKQSQIWIIYRMEPIGAVRTTWFRNNVWINTMNWTWGYRLDSDIFLPSYVLGTRTEHIQRDYQSIYKSKTKMAAWIVSHCHADSLRDEYVRALIKEGIDVDIFGRCSKNRTRVAGNFFYQEVDRHYKFYLSFENHFCKDYVSEKFFKYIAMDTILIVRGGLNYSEHFDKNSFIDVAWFPSVKSLARYMLKVSNDTKLFISYLRAKDKYIIKGTAGYSRVLSTCRLCEHLNNKERYIKTYKT